jgi:hypothetical protein
MGFSLFVTGALSANTTSGPFANAAQCQGESFASEGFSIQLNVLSQFLFMQFGFLVQNNQINAVIDYFDNTASDTNGNLVWNWPDWPYNWFWQPQGPNFAPNNLVANTVPRGFLFEIQLATDGNGDIISATFQVTDKNGQSIGPQTVSIPSTNANPWFGDGRFGLIQLPALTFEVDIGGPGNCSNAVFAPGGGGIITYQADNGLCVGGSLNANRTGIPGGQCQVLSLCSSMPCVQITAESSNVTYGVITDCCDTMIQQVFNTPSS